MDIQTPSGKTVEQVIWNLKKHAQESEERELSWAQQQMSSIQKYIYHILNKPKRPITDELMPVQPITPASFKVPEDELQQLKESLMHKKAMRNDGPPTQQLNNPADIARIAATDTVIMPLPDTGNIPLGPIRLTTVDTAPRESFYTSDEALVLLIAHAVKAHEHKYNGIAPDVIEMPEEVFNLLTGRIDMTEYVTTNRHIPFAINTTLPTTTITNTVKCITY